MCISKPNVLPPATTSHHHHPHPCHLSTGLPRGGVVSYLGFWPKFHLFWPIPALRFCTRVSAFFFLDFYRPKRVFWGFVEVKRQPRYDGWGCPVAAVVKYGVFEGLQSVVKHVVFCRGAFKVS